VCVCEMRSAKCDYSNDRVCLTMSSCVCSHIVKCMNIHFIRKGKVVPVLN
jgi:hypothetical protein